MRNEHAPDWVKEEDRVRRENATALRAQIAVMPDRHIFWILFDSSTGTERMLARCRVIGVTDAETLKAALVREIEMSWHTNSDSPIADLTWVKARDWPSDNMNQTMRFEEIDPDLLAELEMLRHHKLWDRLRRALWRAHASLGGHAPSFAHVL